MRLKGLAPVADRRARILILGSFPGPMSLAKKEYYAYPRNQFWEMVFDLLGADAPDTYHKKLKILKANRIGLWDVIDSCCRKKAPDSAITAPVFNDIATLISRRPGIKAVFCNGATSYLIFKKRYKVAGVPFVYLPSTSPANAGHSYIYKRRSWKKILKALQKTGGCVKKIRSRA